MVNVHYWRHSTVMGEHAERFVKTEARQSSHPIGRLWAVLLRRPHKETVKSLYRVVLPVFVCLWLITCLP